MSLVWVGCAVYSPTENLICLPLHATGILPSVQQRLCSACGVLHWGLSLTYAVEHYCSFLFLSCLFPCQLHQKIMRRKQRILAFKGIIPTHSTRNSRIVPHITEVVFSLWCYGFIGVYQGVSGLRFVSIVQTDGAARNSGQFGRLSAMFCSGK